jgi:formylglycine-generating enzyme required for sulfatase activity
MVEGIEWYLASNFCQTLTKFAKDNHPLPQIPLDWKVGLPTIEQWTKFAASNIKAAGNNMLQPALVALPNPFGLTHVLGTSWQWTSTPYELDCYWAVGGWRQPPNPNWSVHGGLGGDENQKGNTDRPYGFRMIVVPK